MTQVAYDISSQIKAVNSLLEAGEPANISVDDYSHHAGYKPQYIIDALNQTFGFGNWGFEEVSNEIAEGEKVTLIVSQVRVFLKDCAFQPTGWGQARITKGDIGDARKGAQTDAIKKALSYFSIGNKAYQGLLVEDANGNLTQVKNVHPGQNGKQQTPPKQQATKKTVDAANSTPKPKNPVDALKLHAVNAKFITGKDKDELAKAWKDRLRAVFQREVSDTDLAESEALRGTLREFIERYQARMAATNGK